MKYIRGFLLLLLVGALIHAGLYLADPGYQIQGIPENLVIVYDFGSTNAAWGRTRVELTADGKMQRFDLRGIRKVDEKPTGTFTVSPEGLKRIVATINQTRFFKLAPSYEDSSITDGASMYISVQAGEASHMVSARNTSVASLDRIAAAILAEGH